MAYMSARFRIQILGVSSAGFKVSGPARWRAGLVSGFAYRPDDSAPPETLQ